MYIILTIDGLSELNESIPCLEKAIGPYMEALYHDDLNYFWDGVTEIYHQLAGTVPVTKYFNMGNSANYTWVWLDLNSYLECCYFELLKLHQVLILNYSSPVVKSHLLWNEIIDVVKMNPTDVMLKFHMRT